MLYFFALLTALGWGTTLCVGVAWLSGMWATNTTRLAGLRITIAVICGLFYVLVKLQVATFLLVPALVRHPLPTILGCLLVLEAASVAGAWYGRRMSADPGL